jgi:hypothetical protein
MPTKTCKQCGVDKDLNEFFRQSVGKWGVKRRCKLCTRLQKLSYDSEYNNARLNKEHISQNDFLLIRSIKRDRKSKESGFDAVAFVTETECRLSRIIADGKWH